MPLTGRGGVVDKKRANRLMWLQWFLTGLGVALALLGIVTYAGGWWLGNIAKFISIVIFCVMMPAAGFTHFGADRLVQAGPGFDGRPSVVHRQYPAIGGLSTGYSIVYLVWLIGAILI